MKNPCNGPGRAVLAACLLVLSSCTMASYTMDGAEANAPDAPRARTGPSRAGGDPPSPAGKRLLIYRAWLDITVENRKAMKTSIETAAHVAKEAGGFMQERTQRSVTIRVPVAKFPAVLASLKRLGQVSAERVTASDVTEKHYDLEIRLKNALAVRDRLEQLLKLAKDVEDALRVETELGRIREKIETLKGRKTFLERHAALSTIEIVFSRVYRGPPPKVAYKPGILGYPFVWAWKGFCWTADKAVWLFVRTEPVTGE